MELSYDQLHTYAVVRYPNQRIPTRERVAVRCVLCGEKHPSCTLFLNGPGGVCCHSCGFKGNFFQFEAKYSNCDLRQAELNIASITGAKPSAPSRNLGPLIARYPYRDESGKLLYEKWRYHPEGRPKEFQFYRNTDKGLVLYLDPPGGPKTRRVLYNLPFVVPAQFAGVCEGEKDADNCTAANLFADSARTIAFTCTHGGANGEWLDSYSYQLTGKYVVIFADNDAPGRKYAETVAARVKPYAYSVKIVSFDELPEKGDVSDYLETHTVAELEAKIKSAPFWIPPKVEHDDWLVRAVDWAAAGDPQIDYRIDGVIQTDANGIIAAEPKTGKSLAALDMLISLACGVPWLGRNVPRRVRTAYISREDSPVLTRVRITGFLRGKGLSNFAGNVVDPGDYLWVNTREQLGDFSVDNDEHLRHMAYDLKEHGVEFAIFDVFNRLHARSENDNTEMAKVVERISQMGREAGCNIGLVHHVSKENGSTGRFFTRIRGASAIHGWTEWSIGLTLENPNSDGLKLIRKAEFETKAGESSQPISFTVEFGSGALHLAVVNYAEREAARNSARPSRYQ